MPAERVGQGRDGTGAPAGRAILTPDAGRDGDPLRGIPASGGRDAGDSAAGRGGDPPVSGTGVAGSGELAGREGSVDETATAGDAPTPATAAVRADGPDPGDPDGSACARAAGAGTVCGLRTLQGRDRFDPSGHRRPSMRADPPESTVRLVRPEGAFRGESGGFRVLGRPRVAASVRRPPCPPVRRRSSNRGGGMASSHDSNRTRRTRSGSTYAGEVWRMCAGALRGPPRGHLRSIRACTVGGGSATMGVGRLSITRAGGRA